MKLIHNFAVFFIALMLFSCENELMNEHETVRTGSFYSLEVEIQNNNSLHDETIQNSDFLPDFPYAKTLKTSDYTLQVFDEDNNVVDTWSQEISEDFTFTLNGSGTLIADHLPIYSTLQPFYTLSGTTIIDANQTEVTIEMTNINYAAIAVYDQYINSISINGTSVIPIIDAENGKSYYYTYTEPLQPYEVIVTDVLNNTHTISGSDLNANELLRIASDHITPFSLKTGNNNRGIVSEVIPFQ